MDQVLEQFFVEKNKIYFISVLNQILLYKILDRNKAKLNNSDILYHSENRMEM